MKHKGSVYVVYRHKEIKKRHIDIPFAFVGFISLFKTVLMAYKTRCDEVKIIFDTKKKSNDK